MLRKHAVRKMFFGHGLLLMIPVATFYHAIAHSTPFRTVSASVTLFFSPHDSLKTVAPDSSAATPPIAVTTISLNKQAMRYAKAYVEKEEMFLHKMKSKSRPFFKTIESVFDQYNLPPQLKYLAIVESELRSTITSKAGARGLWQFMPLTATELGLKVSGKTDERTHTYRSTVAAAKYLRRLHAEFGDWLLVLAAYNSGPGTVYKAIKKAGTKNYWALQRFLPAESRGHVKHFIGVHYFFEGEGSVVTQTRAEAKAYQEKLCAEEAKKALLASVADTTSIL